MLTRAFACATPVVASDIAGYRGVMEPEAGLLVPPGDPAALAEAVVALLEDERRRMELGRAARALAQERYSWDRHRAAARRDLRGPRRLAKRGRRREAACGTTWVRLLLIVLLRSRR